jgi:hypothetical protein
MRLTRRAGRARMIHQRHTDGASTQSEKRKTKKGKERTPPQSLACTEPASTVHWGDHARTEIAAEGGTKERDGGKTTAKVSRRTAERFRRNHHAREGEARDPTFENEMP